MQTEPAQARPRFGDRPSQPVASKIGGIWGDPQNLTEILNRSQKTQSASDRPSRFTEIGHNLGKLDTFSPLEARSEVENQELGRSLVAPFLKGVTEMCNAEFMK